MLLRRKIFLLVTAVTSIFLLIAALSLITFVQRFTQESQTEEAQELRAGWLFKLDSAHKTAYSVSDLIIKDEITKRYYRDRDNMRDTNLYSAYSSYIADLIKVFPDIAEISLLFQDGREDIRVAFNVTNQSEVQKGNLIPQTFLKPHHDQIAIEYHEDFETPVLVFYRGIEMLSSINTPQKPEMQTVAVIRISVVLDDILSTSDTLAHQQLAPLLIDDNGRTLYSAEDVEWPEQLRRTAMGLSQGFFEDEYNTWFMDRYQWRPGIHLLSLLEANTLSTDVTEALITISFSGLLVLLLLPLILGLFFRSLVLLPLESVVKAADDTEQDISDRHLQRKDEIGMLLNAFVSMRKRLVEQNSALRKQVFKDGLTGLPNRNALPHILQVCAEQSQVTSLDFALLFLDLDGFKQVNDVHGHASGDELLKKVAIRVSSQLRTNDRLYHFLDDEMSLDPSLVRLGGDEFTIILPSVRGRSNAREVAHRIIAGLEKPFNLQGAEVYVGCSIGISLFPSDTDNLEELIQFSDTAMYEAKRRGKMQAVLYDFSMSDSEMAQMEISKVLHHAIEHDEVEAWFQPKVDPVANRIRGFEALARINSKKFGFISPAKFIPIAENSPLIDTITLRCLESCCRLHKHLEIEFSEHIRMSLNLSPRQFENQELFDKMAEIVRRHDIAPEFLELEVTETSIMQYKELGKQLLETLKKMGFKTSLDDFGTGYSSLGYLREFTFDTLKIDRLFFNDITDDASKTILESILQLARNLNMTVVAEGIETAEQLQFVKDHQLDLVQGYIYSRPLAQGDVVEFVKLFQRTREQMSMVKTPG